MFLMRILIISTSYPPYVSGVATSTANLASQLSKKHQITVISSTPNKIAQNKSLNKNLNLYLLPGISVKQKNNLIITYPHFKKLKTILKSFQPQIIHLQDFSPTSLSAINLAREYQIPIIITHHFTAEFIVKSLISAKKLSFRLSQAKTSKQFIYRLVNLIYNRCQLVTVPNSALIPYFHQAKLKTPIISIPNGINTKQFSKKKSLNQILTKYQIKQTKIILFVGRLEIDKSLDILINAFKPINQQNPDTALVFVGEGKKKPKLKKLVSQHSLNHSVYFLGKINNQNYQLSHIYNSAYLFANPSIIENQSVSFLEAFTAGLPIIASYSPIQTNLIKPNYNGLIAEPNSEAAFSTAIQKLLSDTKLYKTISQNNKKTARQYNIKKTSQQYLKTYQSLL